MHLTKSELEVMEVFWRVGEPLSQLELLENAQQKSWKDRSVYILLNGLLTKGVLQENGFIRSGKTFARRFSPTVSYEEYCVMELSSRSRQVSLSKLMSAFIKQQDVTRQDLDELQAILDQAKQDSKRK